MRHVLKCEQPWFQAIWDGAKPFEIRRDDRRPSGLVARGDAGAADLHAFIERGEQAVDVVAREEVIEHEITIVVEGEALLGGDASHGGGRGGGHGESRGRRHRPSEPRLSRHAGSQVEAG